MLRRNAIYVAVGLCFGFLLSGSGLARYDVIHQMLRFENWDPYLIMAGSIGTALPLLWILQRRGWVTPLGGRMALAERRVERRQVYGGVAFGVGWAVTGACPGTVSAMIGGGSVMGLAILAGILLGIRAFEAVEQAQRARTVQVPAAPIGEPAPAVSAGS